MRSDNTNHPPLRAGGGGAAAAAAVASKQGETFPLLSTAVSKVLSRTYEATTVEPGKKLPRKGSFRSVESSSSAAADVAAAAGAAQHTRTTDRETVLHLLKGYLGAGCLSLPFAVSQLGIVGGILGIAALSYWTSANCYTVVK